MRGEIIRMMRDKRFGFLRGTDMIERFFHADCCFSAFDELKEGDKVDFQDKKNPKGPRAEDVTLAPQEV